MEYVPQHDISLPRAPAFRDFNPRAIDGIVERLTMKPKDRFPHFKFNKRDRGWC